MVQLEEKHINFVKDMVCSGFTMEEILVSFVNRFPDTGEELLRFYDPVDPEKALINLVYEDDNYVD